MTDLLQRLYGRISAAYLGLAVVLVALCAWVTTYHFNLFSSEVDQKVNRKLAQNIAMDMGDALQAGRYRPALAKMSTHLAMLNPALELYVLDRTGQILAHSQDASAVELDRVSTEPITAFLNETEPLPIWGDYPCAATQPKVFSAAEIRLPEGSGYLYVILRGKTAGSAASMLQESYILRTVWVYLLLVFGFTGLVGLTLFAYLTRPFRRLTDVVRDFKSGTHDRRMEVERDDEIGELGRAFNEMADTIEAQVDALRQTDEARRKLVATVSHDFRTPLTSIRGHVERLLDSETRASEEATETLEMILKNTNRLDRLAGQLHELSHLDAREVEPSFEPFTMAELVHDIALKFRPQAESAGIELSVDRRTNDSYVHADIGLIDRLISNLVDNAIHHTPDGGRVCIAVDAAEDGVSVQVEDTGPGIPATEIPLITQRFYQVDGDGTGSGLGLSIAREIADLHNGELVFESTPGKGTVVSLNLPSVQ